MAKLTARQKTFIAEYLVDLNATQAAIRAGYSKRTADVQGPRLLGNVGVAAEIEKRSVKRAERLELSADYVLEGIRDTVERCRQAVPVVDRKGNPVLVENPEGKLVPAYTFQALPALKGFELIGKHLKLFTEKIEIDDKRPILLRHSVPRQEHDP